MSKEVFKDLYEQYFDSIRSYIYYRSGEPELATDVTQEVFIKLWEKRNQFQLGQVKSLLYKMASDIFINQYRKQQSGETYKVFMQPQMNQMQDEGPAAELEFKELTTLYENTLETMSENDRITFLMSRREGLSYKEIAERLEIGQKAVEKRMSSALRILRNVLKPN